MKNPIIILMLLIFFLACTEEKKELQNKQVNSYSDFKTKLTPNMNYDSLVAAFGAPDTDLGRGIHIYVYKLMDSTEAWIGFTDSIIYARQVNKNQEVINELLNKMKE